MKEICKVQSMMFELMKLASFNSFDGEQVVRDLIDNRDLWQGVVMDREGLIKLRDIQSNDWNVDTLYITTTGVNDVKLEELAEDWSADEVEYLTPDEASHELGQWPAPSKVLRIWWD